MKVIVSLHNRKIFLIVALCFMPNKSHAQYGKDMLQLRAINFGSKDTIQSTQLFNGHKQLISQNTYYLTATENRNILPQNYYITSLGFFCKKEWLLEKSTKMPVRFRLGSLSYCNKLEGKER